MSGQRNYQFDKFGRTYQFRIRTAEDLRRVLALDESLWIATSAPLDCLNSNQEFLHMVDTDGNGRIRSDEMNAAIQWLLDRLADASDLAEATDDIRLAAVNSGHPEGQGLVETAAYVQETLRLESRDRISLAEINGFSESLETNAINGDGIITPEAAADAEIGRFIADVLSCFGGKEDHTGRPGIDATDVGEFLRQARAHLNWAQAGEVAPGETSEIMPLGPETGEAYGAFDAVREKIEGFFARCRLVWFDPSAAAHRRVTSEGSVATWLDDVETVDQALARAPLAEPNAGCELPLSGRINPLYGERLAAFRRKVVEPILGDCDTLSSEQWIRIKSTFAAHEAWLAQRQGEQVEKLGRDRLQKYLDSPHPDAVREMLARDREVADRLADLSTLKKLLLYHKHILRLANNFVSFPELYDPGARAMFEEGSVVMDGRWFSFALLVPDINEHVEVVKDSSTFVMYVELTRAETAGKRTVAVPVTSGTIGNLRVGKRGVFFDVCGTEYDARVVRIIENPVSFKETLLAPFSALGRLIVGKIEAISGSAQKELESTVSKTAEQVQSGVQQTVREAPQAAAAEQSKVAAEQAQQAAASSNRRDLLVGASVSVAALSSAFAFITKTLSDLKLTTVLAAVLIGLVLVFLPSAIVAFLKLRRRDLSAILEGSRWAINARMRLTRRQRRQFTRQEPYPADAAGTPRSRWWGTVLWILVLAALAWGCWKGWSYLRRREAAEANAPVAGQAVEEPPANAAEP